MRILRKNIKNKLIALFLLLMFFSCNSLDNDEYEILNLAISKCVFKELDPEEIIKTEAQYKVDPKEAMDIIYSKMKDEQYTFTMSDSLYEVNISKGNWESLHHTYYFDEIKNRSSQSIPIDFSKIETPKNIKRIATGVHNKNYLVHFKFHRVLFDKSKKRAYIQIDLPEERISFGPIGLRLKKENGEWKFEK